MHIKQHLTLSNSRLPSSSSRTQTSRSLGLNVGFFISMIESKTKASGLSSGEVLNRGLPRKDYVDTSKDNSNNNQSYEKTGGTRSVGLSSSSGIAASAEARVESHTQPVPRLLEESRLHAQTTPSMSENDPGTASPALRLPGVLDKGTDYKRGPRTPIGCNSDFSFIILDQHISMKDALTLLGRVVADVRSPLNEYTPLPGFSHDSTNSIPGLGGASSRKHSVDEYLPGGHSHTPSLFTEDSLARSSSQNRISPTALPSSLTPTKGVNNHTQNNSSSGGDRKNIEADPPLLHQLLEQHKPQLVFSNLPLIMNVSDSTGATISHLSQYTGNTQSLLTALFGFSISTSASAYRAFHLESVLIRTISLTQHNLVWTALLKRYKDEVTAAVKSNGGKMFLVTAVKVARDADVEVRMQEGRVVQGKIAVEVSDGVGVGGFMGTEAVPVGCSVRRDRCVGEELSRKEKLLGDRAFAVEYREVKLKLKVVRGSRRNPEVDMEVENFLRNLKRRAATMATSPKTPGRPAETTGSSHVQEQIRRFEKLQKELDELRDQFDHCSRYPQAPVQLHSCLPESPVDYILNLYPTTAQRRGLRSKLKRQCGIQPVRTDIRYGGFIHSHITFQLQGQFRDFEEKDKREFEEFIRQVELDAVVGNVTQQFIDEDQDDGSPSKARLQALRRDFSRTKSIAARPEPLTTRECRSAAPLGRFKCGEGCINKAAPSILAPLESTPSLEKNLKGCGGDEHEDEYELELGEEIHVQYYSYT